MNTEEWNLLPRVRLNIADGLSGAEKRISERFLA